MRPQVFNTAREAEYITKYGVDFCVSISRPTCNVCPKSEWVPDSSRSDCTFCHTPFTFLHRKHHCRRCAQLVCGTCSHVEVWTGPRDYIGRLCDLCYNIVFEKSSISVYFPFCKLLTDDSPSAVKVEVVRALRNCLQSESNRSVFIENRRDLLDHLITMFNSLSLDDTGNDTYFEPMSKESDVLGTQIAGVFVNLSATLHDSVLSAMRGAGVIQAILPYCQSAPLESPSHNEVLQELALWTIRNLSRDAACVVSICNQKIKLNQILIECITSSVRTIQDYALSILANIVFHQEGVAVQGFKDLKKMANVFGSMLSGDFAPVQEASCRCISNISKHSAEFAKFFLESGFVNDLIGCLSSPETAVTFAAISACCSLSGQEDRIRERIANNNVVNFVYDLLKKPVSAIHLVCINLLEVLVQSEKCRNLLFDQNDLEDLLFGLLSNTDVEELSACTARVVKQLSKADNRGAELKRALKNRRDQ
ncbi:hypothetical protein P9112_014623 [Eukaryota sp. TZLM1-RC]